MKEQYILVTGGAGYIGSHVVKLLSKRGYHPIIYDNLSLSMKPTHSYGTFVKRDLANPEELQKIFEKYPILAVMHFAAFTNVGESVLDPGKYYENNIVNSLNLLNAMRTNNVKAIVFSSSAAIFGMPLQHKMSENHPCNPVNPYGQTKLIIENILEDYDKAYDIKFSALRYFNAAGGDPEGKLKNTKPKENNLIPIVLRSLKQESGSVTIFGTDYPTIDGTCIRDYIHVEDLATAHMLALEYLLQERHSTYFNLGNGNGFSVRQVIQAIEMVTGIKVNAIEGLRRPGDPPVLVADSQKAQEVLGWKPCFSSLEMMVSHAWQAL